MNQHMLPEYRIYIEPDLYVLKELASDARVFYALSQYDWARTLEVCDPFMSTTFKCLGDDGEVSYPKS